MRTFLSGDILRANRRATREALDRRPRVAGTDMPMPEAGDLVTLSVGSDRYPYMITSTSDSGKTVYIHSLEVLFDKHMVKALMDHDPTAIESAKILLPKILDDLKRTVDETCEMLLTERQWPQETVDYHRQQTLSGTKCRLKTKRYPHYAVCNTTAQVLILGYAERYRDPSF